MSDFKLEEGMVFIDVIEPPKKDNLQKTESGIFMPIESQEAAHEWKDCKIVVTCDEEKYPVGSVWMIGSDPGSKIKYKDTIYTLYRTGGLKARIS